VPKAKIGRIKSRLVQENLRLPIRAGETVGELIWDIPWCFNPQSQIGGIAQFGLVVEG
jgi:hypothetical protein